MTDPIARKVREYVEAQTEQFLDELIEFVRQPSVSATGEGVKQCATLLRRMMEAAGLRTQVITSDGYDDSPLLLGEWGPEDAKVTVCLYAHYDTCPPTEPGAWTTPPYSPDVRDGRIYGAGIADDKAQAVTILKAVEAVDTLGLESARIRVLLEGEEEQYSPHLPGFVSRHRDLIDADVLLGADGEAHEEGPLVALGLKGTLFVRLEVKTAERAMPNGYAPVARNALWRLVEALSSLRAPNGTVLIDGFYDRVEAITPEENRWLYEIPYDKDSLLAGLRVKHLDAKSGTDYHRRLYMYPAATIAGMQGGYVGQGVKNVLPEKAFATIDFQIVPNQTCEEIEQKLRNHMRRQGFDDVEITVLQRLGSHRIALDHPYVSVVRGALSQAYGRDPVMTPCYRGAGGVGHQFVEAGIPVIWIPCLHPMDNNMHGVDENVRIEDVLDGIVAKAVACHRFRTAGAAALS